MQQQGDWCHNLTVIASQVCVCLGQSKFSVSQVNKQSEPLQEYWTLVHTLSLMIVSVILCIKALHYISVTDVVSSFGED